MQIAAIAVASALACDTSSHTWVHGEGGAFHSARHLEVESGVLVDAFAQQSLAGVAHACFLLFVVEIVEAGAAGVLASFGWCHFSRSVVAIALTEEVVASCGVGVDGATVSWF